MFLILLMISAVSSFPFEEDGCRVEMVEQCYQVPGMDCGDGEVRLRSSLGSESYRVKRADETLARTKRQEGCVKKIVRNCIVMEDTCTDLPHMNCEGEGENKECETVLKPVCWAVPREDLSRCVDEEVCEWVDDGVVPEVVLPKNAYSVANIGPIEDYESLEDYEGENVSPRCTAVWMQVCRPVPQAVNCDDVVADTPVKPKAPAIRLSPIPPPPAPVLPPPAPVLPPPAPVCAPKSDIVFLIDSSGSINAAEWDLTLAFANQIIDAFTVGPQDTQFGITTFSSSAENQFFLNSHNDKASLEAAVASLPKQGGLTRLHHGLSMVGRDQFVAANGDRIGVPNFLVVLTDGATNDLPTALAEADGLKQRGVKIFSIGVGPGAVVELVQGVTSHPHAENADYWLAEDFQQLLVTSLTDQIIQGLCGL